MKVKTLFFILCITSVTSFAQKKQSLEPFKKGIEACNASLLAAETEIKAKEAQIFAISAQREILMSKSDMLFSIIDSLKKENTEGLDLLIGKIRSYAKEITNKIHITNDRMNLYISEKVLLEKKLISVIEKKKRAEENLALAQKGKKFSKEFFEIKKKEAILNAEVALKKQGIAYLEVKLAKNEIIIQQKLNENFELKLKQYELIHPILHYIKE